MCNACGNLCCGSDMFSGCGCDCDCEDCWSDEDENCDGDLTVDDVMAAHVQFGTLNRASVKESMGQNWPQEWDQIQPGQGIFATGPKGPTDGS